MPSSRTAVAVLLLAALSSTACTRTIPPPPAPAPAMPALEAQPGEPESGMARVFFSTDVPARVTRVTTGSVSRGWRTYGVKLDGLLCESTPCAVTLPYGDYEIAFEGVANDDRRGAAVVHVRRPTEVVNHHLGKKEASAAHSLGIGLAGLGVVLLGVLVGVAETTKPTPQARQVAQGLAAGGLGSLFLGGTLMMASPEIHQEGSTTQWAPGTAGRTIGTGVGVRF